MSQIKRCVSLYSYQDEYCRKRMTLEQIFDELDSLGVEGVEIITDQMVKGTPFPSEEELAKWDNILKTHKVKPVCNDVFINTTLYNNRTLRKKEAVESLENDIRLSARLGFPMIRLVSKTPAEIVEAALPCAEKYNVKLALEVHGGMSFSHHMTKEFCNMIFRLNSPYLGLVVDTGIFCRKHPEVAKNYFLSLGLNPEIAKYIDAIYAKGTDPMQYFKNGIPSELEAMIKSQTDREYVLFCDGYESSDYSIMDKYLPYIYHFHGKCYGFGEDGEEYSISFGEIIEYLYKNNYNGYIATEYEGNRFVAVGGISDGVGNVRLHQKLLKKYIDKFENKAGVTNV